MLPAAITPNSLNPAKEGPVSARLRSLRAFHSMLHERLNVLESILEPIAPTADTQDGQRVPSPIPTCKIDSELSEIELSAQAATNRIDVLLARIKL